MSDSSLQARGKLRSPVQRTRACVRSSDRCSGRKQTQHNLGSFAVLRRALRCRPPPLCCAEGRENALLGFGRCCCCVVQIERVELQHNAIGDAGALALADLLGTTASVRQAVRPRAE